MKIGWGWKIGLLYSGFVLLIATLVIGSSRQQIDLVSKDYYEKEIAYQDVIDGSKNQSALSGSVSIHANEQEVVINFPKEFYEKNISGNIQFYSPINAAWDFNYVLQTSTNTVAVSRNKLHNTRYHIKITYEVDGRKYYNESEIVLPE